MVPAGNKYGSDMADIRESVGAGIFVGLEYLGAELSDSSGGLDDSSSLG